MVAVFGSSNVMAATSAQCENALTAMNTQSVRSISKLVSMCAASTEASNVILGAAANGYHFVGKPTAVTRTSHGNKTIYVGQSLVEKYCDGSSKSVSTLYAMLHEMYHATNPGTQSLANETRAVSNTNYIRKANNKAQRATYTDDAGQHTLTGVCH